MKDLKNYRDIIIKEADKGSAVVVWDRKDYCSEAYRHLNDMVVYEKLQENPLNDISDRVKQAFKPLLDKGYISSKNLEYPRCAETTVGVDFIYCLKFTSGLKMCQVDRLYLTVVRLQNECRSFWIFIFNHWWKVCRL